MKNFGNPAAIVACVFVALVCAGRLGAQLYSMPAEPPDAEVDPLTTGIEWQGSTGLDEKLTVVPVYNAQGVHIANDVVRQTNGGQPTTTQHPINPQTPIQSTPDVLLLLGSMGADTIDLRGFFPPPIPGMPPLPKCFICGLGGNDIIVGTLRDDFIFAGAGDDTVFDFLGNDTIFGNDGSDAIWGGEGDDAIYGNSGDDNKAFPPDPASGKIITRRTGLVGSYGNDIILGGPGNDRIFGEDGDEKLVCNDAAPGNGTLHIVEGGLGNDEIWGCNDDSRPDRLSGDDPADTSVGGMDKISTGKGPDQVDAGPQNDQIFVGEVSPSAPKGRPMRATGGMGSDYIQLGKAWGEVHGDLPGNFVAGDGDTIEILDGYATLGFRIRCGGGSDNVLNGGPGHDEIYGDADNDFSLHGGEGMDGISGGDGSDDVWGGAGNDKISGDGGADTLNGEDGDDEIYDFSNACAVTGAAGREPTSCIATITKQ